MTKKIDGNMTDGIEQPAEQEQLTLEELRTLAELGELEDLAELEELELLEELKEDELEAQLETEAELEAEELEEDAELNEEELDEEELEEELDEDEEEEEEYEGDDGNVAALPVLDGITSEEKAHIAAKAADSLRADDILVLDLRQLTIIADFFLICTGKSSIQIRSITDRIEERLRDHGLRKLRTEGYQEATWILLDYGDLVCHVMAAEQRAFYDLEAFWSSAPKLELDLTPEPTTLQASRTHFESLTPVDEDFDELEDLDELEEIEAEEIEAEEIEAEEIEAEEIEAE